MTKMNMEALPPEGLYVSKERLSFFTTAYNTLLTPAEKQVINFVIEGHTLKEVGELIGINIKTVDTHKSGAFKKLGVNSQEELARLYTAMQERPTLEDLNDSNGGNFLAT